MQESKHVYDDLGMLMIFSFDQKMGIFGCTFFCLSEKKYSDVLKIYPDMAL